MRNKKKQLGMMFFILVFSILIFYPISANSNWDSEVNITEQGKIINGMDYNDKKDYLSFGDRGGRVHIYNTEYWYIEEIIKESDNWITDVSSSPSGDYLASSDRSKYNAKLEGNVYIRDTKDLSLVKKIESNYPITSIGWSPKENYFAYGDIEGNVYIRETKNWSLVKEVEDSTEQTITSIDWSSRGNYLAYSNTHDGTNSGGDVYVRDTKDWSLVKKLTKSPSYGNYDLTTLDFSDLDNYIAYGGQSGETYIHDTEDWSVVKTLKSNKTRTINSIDFSDKKPYIAIGYTSGDLEIYNTEDWSLLKKLQQEKTSINSLEFLDDYIAYGGYDTNVYVNKLPESENDYPFSFFKDTFMGIPIWLISLVVLLIILVALLINDEGGTKNE